MESNQNSPAVAAPTDVSDAEAATKMLTLQQQAWIDYNALGGLMTDLAAESINSDGQPATLRKMPIAEFAKMLGVDRGTLRNWRLAIPNFWDRVNQRRRDLSSQSRLQKVYEVMYMSALKPGEKGYRDRVLFLANFDKNFHMPAQKVEHEAGNSWAALLASKRKRDDSNIQEGEVIDAKAKEVQ